MAQLTAWSIDRQNGESTAGSEQPRRVERSHIALEKHLEDWIANDVTLIAEGLTLVGRQVAIDDGRLDLLAIDSQDRWVVIEIKPGLLDAYALTQALYYASSIARLSGDELFEKLKFRLDEFGDVEELVKQQLEGEEQEREIAVMLVGAGIHPGLARMKEFLGRFGVPISIVSFEVFELTGGPQLLIREVAEEPVESEPARAPGRRLTVEAIRHWAKEVGVDSQFDRFVNISKEAGLAVQPQRASVRIAPATNRTRFLMYAQPHSGDSGGELRIHVGPKQFAEFFPHVDEREAIDAIGELDGACVGGEALDRLLDQIERFLTDKVRRPDGAGG